MGDLPLRTPTDRRPGGPSPRLLPNQTHPHPEAASLSCNSDAIIARHPALIRFSPGYSGPQGRLDTRYSPVRRSPSPCASTRHAAPRLACVKPVASVHPEPGSNSPSYKCIMTPRKGRQCLISGRIRVIVFLTCHVRRNATAAGRVHVPGSTAANTDKRGAIRSLYFPFLSPVQFLQRTLPPVPCTPGRMPVRRESGCKGSNIIRTGKIFPEKNAPTYESFPISLQKHRQKLIHIIYNICARGGTRKTCERAHACRDVFTAAFPVGERGTGTATRLSSRRESDWKDAGWQRL